MDFNKLLARVKAILLTPKTEWPVIAGEPATIGDLYKNYILILAAIPAVIGLLLALSWGFGQSVISVIVQYAATLAMVYIMALIVEALAPTFGGQKDRVQALKVVGYSLTAGWVASIGTLIPLFGVLVALAGLVYGIYLLYLGLPHTMKCPTEKAAGYTAVVIVAGIVVGLVVFGILGRLTGYGTMPGSSFSISGNDDDVTFDRDSPLGKLEEYGKKMEQAGKQMEAAEKSGDSNAQAEAMKALMGAALGGGQVEALSPDQLKPFIPGSVAGLPRTEVSAERNNAMGMQISEARAIYANEDGRSVRLEITDTASAKGLLGLAGWAGVEGEKQTDNGYEKTYREGGRLVHEEWNGSNGGYTVVLGDRFTVTVNGYADSIDELKTALSDVDLSGLEALKDEGVKAN